MTRVHHAHPQHGVSRPTVLEQPRAAPRKKKPYKIVLEAVTQEKKKLHSIISYASNAPTGFGFVPAGHPELTEWCKEQCRQRNLDVHVVSAKPRNNMHTDPQKLAHHVHRVGHHFPLEIVNLACVRFGYTYDDTHGLRKAKNSDRGGWIARHVENYSSRQALHGRPTTETETKNHIQGAVRELFPKIPETDLSAIVNHAFKEGTDRVGNAKELPLARRVQLAVVAHIRHMYTNYDNILKKDGWKEARQQVESHSLAKIKEWRDETGEHSNELEETFREVIVLDDDDESSDDDSSTPDGREPSMEIVSSRATARELQPERYDAYPRMDSHDMRRVPRRTIVVQPFLPPPSPARAGPFYETDSRPIHARTQPLQPVHDRHTPIRAEQFQSAHSRPIDPRPRHAVSQLSSRSSPNLMRDSDGRLYQLQRVEEPRGSPRPRYDHPTHIVPHGSMQGGYVQTPPRNDQLNNHPHSRLPPPPPPPPPPTLSRRTSDQDLVLPSVERETVDLTSSPLRVADGQRQFPVSNSHFSGQAPLQPSKRKSHFSGLQSRADYTEQSVKRSKPVNYENEPPRHHDYPHAGAPPQTRMYQHMDVHNRPRAPPLQETIDLTSSPQRPVMSGHMDHYVSVRNYPAAGPVSHPYVTAPSRRSSPRDGRGMYYDDALREAPRAYVYENDRPYERRLPPHEYIPMREEPPRLRVEDEYARHQRQEVRY